MTPIRRASHPVGINVGPTMVNDKKALAAVAMFERRFWRLTCAAFRRFGPRVLESGRVDAATVAWNQFQRMT